MPNLSTYEKTASISAFLRMLLPKKQLVLLYDWEVRREAQQIISVLIGQGLSLTQDQEWPYFETNAKMQEAIAAADLILVYSSEFAQESEPLRTHLCHAIKLGKPIIELQKSGSPSWIQHSANVLVVAGNLHEVHSKIIEAAKPIVVISQSTVKSSTPSGVKVEDEARELLEQAHKENRRIPLDVIGDRLVLSPKVRTLLEKAVTIDGSYWHQSKLEYARALRFHGEWQIAHSELGSAIDDCSEDLRPEIELELGSLEFELGGIDNGIARSEAALNKINDGDLRLVIKTLRQLGNMHREQSNWERSRDYLSSALVLANMLIKRCAPKPGEDHTEYTIASLMLCDCIREQAGLLLESGKTDECIQCLKEALSIAENPRREAFEYLEGVIHYQMGRFHVRHTRQQSEAIRHLEKSMEILQRYDNPVRTSFACDYLARALIKRGHADDHGRAMSLLNKARRVREAANHAYMVARSDQGIGDCYRDLGDFDRALTSYDSAVKSFIKLGKRNDRAAVTLSTGLVFKKRYERDLKQADLQSSKVHFVSARDHFQKIGLNDKAREAEYLLLSLESAEARSLEELMADAKQQGIDLHMDEVGEYRFHSWIRKLCECKQRGDCPPNDVTGITVDVGDDAAVLAFQQDGYEIVLTTDGAPASLSRRVPGNSPEARELDCKRAEYLAQFSVVHTLSDVLAMGARPVALLLNMHLPRDTPVAYAMAIVENVLKQANKYGARLIGGDIKERAERSVGCVGVGIIKSGCSIRRRGEEEEKVKVKPGDVLAITLAKHPDPHSKEIRRIGCRWAHELLEHLKLAGQEPFKTHLGENPNWKQDFLFLNGQIAEVAEACCGKIKAAMDTSDGIMACLQLLGRENDVHFELRQDLVEDAIDPRVKAIAAELQCPPSQFLFNAGHDWEIVMLVAEEDFEEVRQEFKRHGGELARLGTAQAGRQNDILFVKSDGDTRHVPFFTDEKFVLHATEERILDWEDLASILR